MFPVPYITTQKIYRPYKLLYCISWLQYTLHPPFHVTVTFHHISPISLWILVGRQFFWLIYVARILVDCTKYKQAIPRAVLYFLAPIYPPPALPRYCNFPPFPPYFTHISMNTLWTPKFVIDLCCPYLGWLIWPHCTPLFTPTGGTAFSCAFTSNNNNKWRTERLP